MGDYLSAQHAHRRQLELARRAKDRVAEGNAIAGLGNALLAAAEAQGAAPGLDSSPKELLREARKNQRAGAGQRGGAGMAGEGRASL